MPWGVWQGIWLQVADNYKISTESLILLSISQVDPRQPPLGAETFTVMTLARSHSPLNASSGHRSQKFNNVKYPHLEQLQCYNTFWSFLRC
jgi:hypothetical protein